MIARQDNSSSSAGGTAGTASRRSWAAPKVRRLATSAAETGASLGFDLDESPS